MSCDRTRHEDSTAGFSLVAVLVFMLIASAIVAPFAVMARTRLMIANNEVEQERLSLLAEGLANVISSELTDASAKGKLPLDSTPTGCQSGKYTIAVRIQDHDGLIDLNAANVHLLSQGFVSLGADAQTSEALAEAAIQFRTSANAFAAQAEPQASPVGPTENKQAPFESVSELQEFAALASTSLPDLYETFTVNSKRGTVSLDLAPNRLRTILADTSGSSALVTATAAKASAYTVEVTARQAGSGIAGQAGFIIGAFPTSTAGFRRLSRSPIAEASASQQPSRAASCNALFGAEAAEILRRQN
jgi:general secretion pathway protein K